MTDFYDIAKESMDHIVRCVKDNGNYMNARSGIDIELNAFGKKLMDYMYGHMDEMERMVDEK